MKYSTYVQRMGAVLLGAAPVLAQQPAPTGPVMSGNAPSAAAASTLQPGPAGIARASHVIGAPITDASGSTVGRVVNLASAGGGGLIVIVERTGGSFTGLPLSELRIVGAPGATTPAGTAGPGATRAPSVPGTTLTIDKLTLPGGKEELGTAPALENPTRLDTIWLDSFRKAFPTSRVGGAGAPPATGSRPAGGSSGQPGMPVQPGMPGGSDGASAAGNRIAADTTPPVFLVNVIGCGIEDGTGQRLASVKDIAIAMPDGVVAFAVVAAPAEPGGAEVLHGVPMESLQPGAQGTFLVPGPQEGLTRSPGLDLNRLPSAPDVGIVRPSPPGTPQPDQPGMPPNQPSGPSGTRPDGSTGPTGPKG